MRYSSFQGLESPIFGLIVFSDRREARARRREGDEQARHGQEDEQEREGGESSLEEERGKFDR